MTRYLNIAGKDYERIVDALPSEGSAMYDDADNLALMDALSRVRLRRRGRGFTVYFPCESPACVYRLADAGERAWVSRHEAMAVAS